jgi:hypothetical protein
MHHSAYLNAEKFYHKYCESGIENKKILDVGSYDVVHFKVTFHNVKLKKS